MTTVTKPYQDFVNNIDVVDAVKINAQINAIYNFLNNPNIDFTNLAAAIYSINSLANTLVERDASQNIAVNFVKSGQNPNVLFNPTARLGFTGWTKVGTDGTWTAGFGSGAEGGYFFVSSSVATAATTYYESQKIPCTASSSITLQAEISSAGQTAGQVPQVEIHAFSAADADLGVIASVNLALGTGWTRVTATGTTPANTSYLKVRLVYWSGSISTATGYRKIKVEGGAIATTFSDDSTMNTIQYGSVMPFPQVLSGGNKIQSGVANITTSAAVGNYSVTVTFPIAFATAPIVTPSTVSNIPDIGPAATQNGATPTTVTIWVRQTDATARTINVNYIAIGT